MSLSKPLDTIDDLFFIHCIRFTNTAAQAAGIDRSCLHEIRAGKRMPRTRSYRGRPSEVALLARFFKLSEEEILRLAKNSVVKASQSSAHN
jgi:hypothetical protein